MARKKAVIAHRGASAYLPEHTLAAKVLAHAQGADYLEQDVVMTGDDQLIVMHDPWLDRVTDVAARFPGRQRRDGHFYAVDFSMEEIRSLRAGEPVVPGGAGHRPQFPGRFPPGRSRFHIHTLAEEIELIQGLNATSGREAGIYPEIKCPAFYHGEGKDLAAAVLKTLKDYGYTTRDSKIYLQTFDHEELRRVREELLPRYGMDLKLVQLVAAAVPGKAPETTDKGEPILDPDHYGWMLSRDGMHELARHADGIGPYHSMVVSPDSRPGTLRFSGLVGNAHAAGLEVHPYTLRADAGFLPAYARDLEEWLEIFYFRAGVDGLFTDFPDRAVRLLEERGR